MKKTILSITLLILFYSSAWGAEQVNFLLDAFTEHHQRIYNELKANEKSKKRERGYQDKMTIYANSLREQKEAQANFKKKLATQKTRNSEIENEIKTMEKRVEEDKKIIKKNEKSLISIRKTIQKKLNNNFVTGFEETQKLAAEGSRIRDIIKRSKVQTERIKARLQKRKDSLQASKKGLATLKEDIREMTLKINKVNDGMDKVIGQSKEWTPTPVTQSQVYSATIKSLLNNKVNSKENAILRSHFLLSSLEGLVEKSNQQTQNANLLRAAILGDTKLMNEIGDSPMGLFVRSYVARKLQKTLGDGDPPGICKMLNACGTRTKGQVKEALDSLLQVNDSNRSSSKKPFIKSSRDEGVFGQREGSALGGAAQ